VYKQRGKVPSQISEEITFLAIDLFWDLGEPDFLMFKYTHWKGKGMIF
jgi:hypothetical protein